MKSIKVGLVDEIRKEKTRKFVYQEEGREVEGFVVYFKKSFFAYANKCKHVSIPLDFGDGDFLTEDADYILCKNHGAIYLPDSGECIDGPCAGQSLDRLEIEIRGKDLYCRVA